MNCAACWMGECCGYCNCCPAELKAAVPPRKPLAMFAPVGAHAYAFDEFIAREWQERQTVYERHQWTGGDDDEDHCANCDTTWDEATEECNARLA